MEIFKPLLFNILPIEEAEIPLPKDETTPPVTKMYFVINLLF
jgi:hypothetical protein